MEVIYSSTIDMPELLFDVIDMESNTSVSSQIFEQPPRV